MPTVASELPVDELIASDRDELSAQASRPLMPLTPIEIWSGVLLGSDPARRDRDALPEPPPPRVVLEEILLPALSRTPCLVAFSGGRDSSAILATATDVARRHGLPDPVPVTYLYEHPRTRETEWQEAVIRHLGLEEWLTIAVGSQFDVLGDLATGALRRHGLFWPPNAHTMLPLLRAARGGSLLTGNGGDEVLTPWASRWIAQVRRGRVRPAAKDFKWALFGLSPRPLRELAMRRRPRFELPWLRPQGRRDFVRSASRRWGRQTRSWAEQIEDVGRLRYVGVAQSAFQAFADDAGCALVEPFYDRGLMRATGRHAPEDGYESRAAALEALFGDVLPPETLSRSTKAVFTEVFRGPSTASFVSGWDGTGVDERLVDPAVLRQIWAQARPDFRSLTALQATWLASTDQA